MKNDRDRMKCIISETIVALCNSGLDFSSELCVEGLLGITLDGRDILLVNINEVIKSGVTGVKTSCKNVLYDTGNKPILSEVATSIDRLTAKKCEAEERRDINSTYQLSLNSGPESSRNKSEITQVEVKTEPDNVVVINIDEEESNECYPEIGLWTESSVNASTDSVQQIVSEVATLHSSSVQDLVVNIHSSDQHCEKVLKVESTSTSTLGCLARGHQENYLSPVIIPELLHTSGSAPPVQVTRPAGNMHQHSVAFDTTYQMRQYRRYNQSALVDAVTAVQNHTMTVNRASRVFKVPRSTIQIRLLKLSGKKTWGSRSEPQTQTQAQPGSAGSWQHVGRQTVAHAQQQQQQVMLTEDQQQGSSSLPNH